MAFKRSIFATHKSYNIGDFSTFIEIQRRYEGYQKNNTLQVQNNFKTIRKINCFWKDLKADFEEIDENGYAIAEKLSVIKNAEIIIPYRSDIDCECYVLCDKKRYKILDTQDLEKRKMFLKCTLMSLGNEQLLGNNGK